MSESKEKECIISIRSNPSPPSSTGHAGGAANNNASSGNLSSSSINNNNNNSTSSSLDDLNADNNSVDHNHQKSLLNDKLDQSTNSDNAAEESLGGECERESEPTTSSKYLSPSSTLDLFRKLEVIKEIRNKTASLQQVKAKLVQEVDAIESESKCLESFQSELNLLIQEKMAHLEELRQIQHDISVMESTIKQADEEKQRAIESARRLHTEYKPLKDQVNQLRESIGLDKADSNKDEEMIVSILGKLSTSYPSNVANEKSERRSHGHSHNQGGHSSSRTSNNNNNNNKNSTDSSGATTASHINNIHQAQHEFIQNNLNLLSNNFKSLSESKSSTSSTHQSSKSGGGNARGGGGGANSSSKFSGAQNHHFNPNELLMGHQQSSNPLDLPVQLATAALMAHSLHSQSTAALNLHRQQAQVQHHQGTPGFNPFLSALESQHHHHHHQQQQQQQQQREQREREQREQQREPTPSGSGLQSIPPPFRQQPPPMKSCLSCHQQIHRNAPICPLCKAKSRSRNPKKPKKKTPGPAIVQPTATSSPASKSSVAHGKQQQQQHGSR